MIGGVTIAGHTGCVVVEPIISTDDAAALWLRPPSQPDTKCVWLTGPQLRALAAELIERGRRPRLHGAVPHRPHHRPP